MFFIVQSLEGDDVTVTHAALGPFREEEEEVAVETRAPLTVVPCCCCCCCFYPLYLTQLTPGQGRADQEGEEASAYVSSLKLFIEKYHHPAPTL